MTTSTCQRLFRRPLIVTVLASIPLVASAGAPFEDVSKETGFGGKYTLAAWGDFDNDGWVDCYIGTELLRNNKGKKFVGLGRKSGVPAHKGAGIWGDYDNDGYLDLYLLQAGMLLRNDHEGRFTNVTKIMPKRPMKNCRGAVWVDVDGNGFLDLYVGGYEIWNTQEQWPDVVYLNDKGKSFKEFFRTPAVRRARGVTAADFDEDGDMDIYVSNYRLQPNFLWRNDGTGKFTDTARASGVVGGNGHTIGSCWGDFDNDGHLDLMVGNFSHRGQPPVQFLRNSGPDGDFKFQDRSGTVGLHWQESYANPTLADFDNDGFLDFYLVTVYSHDHSVLYRNVSADFSKAPDDTTDSPISEWVFKDVTKETKTGLTGSSSMAAWADYDNDGDLDLAAGGQLFRNPGNDNHWLKVRLNTGPGINRFAIGAQVRVRTGGWTLTRHVNGATGEIGNQNDLTLHFGLGKRNGKVEVEIRWPDSHVQRLVTDVDRLVEVEKPAISGSTERND